LIGDFIPLDKSAHLFYRLFMNRDITPFLLASKLSLNSGFVNMTRAAVQCGHYRSDEPDYRHWNKFADRYPLNERLDLPNGVTSP
jgi:hypothetical protein